MAINEFELRDRVIRAVNDDLERAFAVNQTEPFHVALNDRTQVVDAGFALISIERGGENLILTAVEIDAQKNRFPLEIRNREHIGNGRSKGIARGGIVESHKRANLDYPTNIPKPREHRKDRPFGQSNHLAAYAEALAFLLVRGARGFFLGLGAALGMSGSSTLTSMGTSAGAVAAALARAIS